MLMLNFYFYFEKLLLIVGKCSMFYIKMQNWCYISGDNDKFLKISSSRCFLRSGSLSTGFVYFGLIFCSSSVIFSFILAKISLSMIVIHVWRAIIISINALEKQLLFGLLFSLDPFLDVFTLYWDRKIHPHQHKWY